MTNTVLAEGAAKTAVPLLQVTNLTKEFPGVLAVDNVGLSVAPGEVVSLLGQNGAGKSTLIQVLSGVHPFGSYDGAVRIHGDLAQFVCSTNTMAWLRKDTARLP